MADQRIVEFVRPRWCTIRLATAHDQYLAINQSFGTFAAFRENNPADNKWFHFLSIPRNVASGQFWLFSKAAQGGSGELVTAPEGDRNLRQCFPTVNSGNASISPRCRAMIEIAWCDCAACKTIAWSRRVGTGRRFSGI